MQLLYLLKMNAKRYLVIVRCTLLHQIGTNPWTKWEALNIVSDGLRLKT